MSEDDRMDRAHRLRELREGRRESAESADADAADSADPDATESADPDADESSAGDDEVDASPATDDSLADTVDRIAGATADVPSPEAMGESLEAAADEAATAAEAAVAGVDEGTGRADSTRVLEFTLGEEHYCIDIDYVEEIVKDITHTRVPNTPGFVEGVVDLRGQITTILNPKVLIDAPETTPGKLLVVFDGEAIAEQGHLGWVVDDVRQVAPVSDEEVREAPVDDEYVNGVIDREDGFVVWTSPEAALEAAR